MNIRRLFIVVAALGWGAGIGPVLAQTDTLGAGFYTRGTQPASEVESGRSLTDRFYLPIGEHLSLHPRVTFEAVYEDNVFLDNRNSTSGTFLRLAPGLLGIYGRPTANHIFADYGYILPLDDTIDGYDEEPAHLLVLGAVHDSGKTLNRLRVGLRRFESPDNQVADRLTQDNILFSYDVEHRTSAKTRAGGYLAYELFDYDNDQLYIDYDRLYGAGRLFHQAGARSDVFLQVGVGRDQQDPDGELEVQPGRQSSAEFADVSVGVRGRLTPKTSASGRVGYRWTETFFQDEDPISRWIASFSMETSPFEFSTFGVEVNSDIRPSIENTGLATWNRQITLRVDRRILTERLRGRASVFAGITEFVQVQETDGASTSPPGFVGREDEYWGFSLGTDWWAQENVSLGLSYSYVENDSNSEEINSEAESRSYDSSRWTLRAGWNY